MTPACAALALLVLSAGLIYGLVHRFRWLQARQALREARQHLAQRFGARSHRQLYGSSEEFLAALLDQVGMLPSARSLVEEVIPQVREYHGRAMMGGDSAWEKIRDPFYEQERQPLRVLRAAAGWVVLLGLAGTVLGFGTAMPALREVLAAPDNAPASVEAAPATAVSADRVATGKRLSGVLDSLSGVFTATFAGILSSLLLSVLTLLLIEPAFLGFTHEVDLLGARWFLPLIQAPATLIDDALRGELRAYFEGISERIELVLHPLIRSLAVSLEQMSGLAVDFSGNIRMGVSTLEAFQDSVGRLGGSAEDAVEQLVKVVRLSSDFLRELQALQAEGARALAGPAEKLAVAAAAIDIRIEALDGRLSILGSSSREISGALAAAQKTLATLPAGVCDGLEPLLELQSRTLASTQGPAEQARHEALAQLAVSNQLLRELIATVQAASRQDVETRELGRSLERLNASLADLPGQLLAERYQRAASEGAGWGSIRARLIRWVKTLLPSKGL